MEVRFFKKSEKKLLQKSINDLWKENHVYVRDERVLNHLVLNTPYRVEYAGEDNYSFIGMWDSSDVVGLQGAMPQKANIFGNEYPSLTGTIWFADKTKNKAIDGFDLIRYALDKSPDNALFIGIGASKIAHKLWKLMGAYMFDDFPRWIGIVNEKEVAEYLLESEVFASKTVGSAILKTVKPYPVLNSLQISFDDFVDNSWDSFYRDFSKIYIGVKRDAAFIRWRYLESPILKYHTVSVRTDKYEDAGLSVFRIEEVQSRNGHKFKIGRILEFIAIDEIASIQLANAILSFSDKVVMWDFYCLSDLTVYGLEMTGFRKTPIWAEHLRMPTRFQPIDHEMLRINGFIYVSDRVRKLTNAMANIPWYITRGDADQDRAN